MNEFRIRIRFIFHKDGGLVGGVSDDLPGLILWGETKEKVLLDLPDAVRCLLDADRPEGAPWSVEAAAADFVPPDFIAHGMPAAA
jgi:hypothetical protein